MAFRAALFTGVQYRLMNDPDPVVRRRVAVGRGTLRRVLERLAADSDEEVRERATRRLARGEGRPDDRYHRSGRSRRHWGPDHYPPRIAKALDRRTYRAALAAQAEHYERNRQWLIEREGRDLGEPIWPLEEEWPAV